MSPLAKMGQSDWNDTTLNLLAECWESRPFTATLLESSVNFNYRLQVEERDLVLRISHEQRRPQAWLQAESEFLRYLLKQGLDVASPQISLQGLWFETQSPFFAVAFDWSEGKAISFYDQTAWGIQEIFELGRLLGRLHVLSQAFEPSSSASRPDWARLHTLPDDFDWAPEERVLLTEFEQINKHCQTWERSAQTFGLIHGDINPLNLCVRDDASFTLLDFDDCSYHWFATDLAVVLFHYLLVKSVHNRRLFASKFLQCLLAGYRQERALSEEWEARIYVLLKLHCLWFYLSTAQVLQNQVGPLTAEVHQAMQTRFAVYEGLL
jgi:amicoumacin kinase